MPETPPPATSSPTASPEDQEQALADLSKQHQVPVETLRQLFTPPQVASSVDPPNSPQQASTQPTAAQTQTQPKEQGNMPQPSPAVRDGPGSPPLMAFGVPLARGPNGKLYNPAKGPPPEPQPKAHATAPLKPDSVRTYDESGAESPAPRGGIKGLDAIPKDWPKLPGNVSLGVELAWVQANRLDVVKELPSGGVKVDLSKAYAPAPSKSALGWLETSIRSYAKFIEVASKTASQANDEAEFIRKERMAIAEIDALLKEMYDAEG